MNTRFDSLKTKLENINPTIGLREVFRLKNEFPNSKALGVMSEILLDKNILTVIPNDMFEEELVYSTVLNCDNFINIVLTPNWSTFIIKEPEHRFFFNKKTKSITEYRHGTVVVHQLIDEISFNQEIVNIIIKQK
jgi:hypothetical protein